MVVSFAIQSVSVSELACISQDQNNATYIIQRKHNFQIFLKSSPMAQVAEHETQCGEDSTGLHYGAEEDSGPYYIVSYRI